MAFPRPATFMASIFLVVCAISPCGPNGLRSQEKSTTSRLEGPEKHWRVVALVNGKPLYFEELFFHAITPQLIWEFTELADQPEMKKAFLARERNRIIEQELMYQDAIHRLEVGNTKMLSKINKFAHDEFEKQML